MFFGRAIKTAIATTIVSTSLFGPLAGDAFAKSREKPKSERMARLKSECNRDLAKHLREYDAVTHSIANSPWLTDNHAAVLTAAVAEAKAAVLTDKAELNAATTLETSRSECRAARSHRSRLKVILRVGRATQHADRYDVTLESLQGDLVDLGVMIDELESNGVDVTELRAVLDQIQGALDDASASAGLGDAIMALLDSDEPEAALAEYKEMLESARDAAMALSESIDELDQLVNPPVDEGDGADSI